MYGTNSLIWIVRQERGLWGVFLRDELRKRRDNALMRLANALPKRLIMFCFIRVAAYATGERYGTTVVPELGMMDALGRFTRDHGI